MLAFSVFYKMNPWVQIAFEQSLYKSNALPNAAGAFTSATSVSGAPTGVWKDHRSEFGPIFTF